MRDMSILVAVRYRVIYYFGLGTNSMLTPLFLPDFLLCTVLRVCVVLFYIQLVFFPS
jgi:hypothetical protein